MYPAPVNQTAHVTAFTSPFPSGQLSATELIRDWASQIDDKVALGVMLILTFYTLSRIILPIAMIGYRSFISSPILERFTGFFLSFTETLALGSAVMITAFYLIQNPDGPVVRWCYILGVCVAMSMLYYLVMLLKTRGDKEKRETLISALKESKDEVMFRDVGGERR